MLRYSLFTNVIVSLKMNLEILPYIQVQFSGSIVDKLWLSSTVQPGCKSRIELQTPVSFLMVEPEFRVVKQSPQNVSEPFIGPVLSLIEIRFEQLVLLGCCRP